MEPILRQMSELISHSPLDVSVIREEIRGFAWVFDNRSIWTGRWNSIHVLVYHEPTIFSQLPSEAR